MDFKKIKNKFISYIKKQWNKLVVFKDNIQIKISVNSHLNKRLKVIIAVVALFVLGGGVYVVKNNITHNATVQEIKNNPELQAELAQRRYERHFIHHIAKPAMANYRQYHQIVPSITIAQAIVESNWGESQLYKKANNAFGIKGKYYGKSITYPTNEVINGQNVTEKSKFKYYPNLKTSIKDHNYLLHKIFLKNQSSKNYKKDAHLLKKNHYATDSKYPQHLIKTIRGFHLTKYDKKAILKRNLNK